MVRTGIFAQTPKWVGALSLEINISILFKNSIDSVRVNLPATEITCLPDFSDIELHKFSSSLPPIKNTVKESAVNNLTTAA